MASSNHGVQTISQPHGGSLCPNHNGKKLKYNCENCNKWICSTCKEEEHQKHQHKKLKNIVKGAKRKLQEFVTTVDETEIPRIMKKLDKMEMCVSNNKDSFNNLISNVKIQNESIKKKLDEMEESSVQTCNDMKQKRADEIQTHKRKLQRHLEYLNSKVQEVRDTLQSGNNVLIYDTSSNKIPSEFEDLPLPEPSYITAEFLPGRIELLEKIFGEWNITSQDGRPDYITPQNHDVVSEFTPFKGIPVRAVRGDKNRQAWLSNYAIQTLYLVDQEGEVKQTVNTEVPIQDFCVSPESGEIWYCSPNDKWVRKVVGGEIENLFETSAQPLSLCEVKDNCLAVGCQKRLAKYTQGGQKKENTTSVIYPLHISECPVTNRLAVADMDFKHCGGKGMPFISIFNTELEQLYKYDGKAQPPPKIQFDPNDICFTSAGKLVITDNSRATEVSVSETGKCSYVKTVYTNLTSEAVAVCIHNDALWISFMDGKVKVLK